MADDLNKEAPVGLQTVVDSLPEFVPPSGARPRQSQPMELTEGGALIAVGTIASWLFTTYAPAIPPHVQGALLVLGTVMAKYVMARSRDYRWRGHTKVEE